jgi:predicted RNase H-like HicB family nuclease
MLTKYIQAAMARAKYEILAEDRTFYGHIPELSGVWANEPTLETCRTELESALEDWLLFGLHHSLPIPVLETIDLNQPQEELA